MSKKKRDCRIVSYADNIVMTASGKFRGTVSEFNFVEDWFKGKVLEGLLECYLLGEKS